MTETKGFAGFNSMVSDLSDLPPPPVESKPASTQSTEEPPPSAPPCVKPPEKNNSSLYIAAFGITVVLFTVYSLSTRDIQPPPAQAVSTVPRPSVPSNPQQTAPQSPPIRQETPNVSPPPVRAAVPVQEPHQDPYLETAPPVGGYNNTLTPEQLRYCLALAVRLEGADKIIDNTVQAQVDNYNLLVDDHNIRCSKSRYYQKQFDKINAEVQGRRQIYESQGVNWIRKGHL